MIFSLKSFLIYVTFCCVYLGLLKLVLNISDVELFEHYSLVEKYETHHVLSSEEEVVFKGVLLDRGLKVLSLFLFLFVTGFLPFSIYHFLEKLGNDILIPFILAQLSGIVVTIVLAFIIIRWS